jgi:hypothetical protein
MNIDKSNKEKFKKDLEKLINNYSLENENDTPDFIIADYLIECLDNYSNIIKARDKWYGDEHWKEEKEMQRKQNEDYNFIPEDEEVINEHERLIDEFCDDDTLIKDIEDIY